MNLVQILISQGLGDVSLPQGKQENDNHKKAGI